MRKLRLITQIYFLLKSFDLPIIIKNYIIYSIYTQSDLSMFCNCLHFELRYRSDSLYLLYDVDTFLTFNVYLCYSINVLLCWVSFVSETELVEDLALLNILLNHS